MAYQPIQLERFSSPEGADQEATEVAPTTDPTPDHVTEQPGQISALGNNASATGTRRALASQIANDLKQHIANEFNEESVIDDSVAKDIFGSTGIYEDDLSAAQYIAQLFETRRSEIPDPLGFAERILSVRSQSGPRNGNAILLARALASATNNDAHIAVEVLNNWHKPKQASKEVQHAILMTHCALAQSDLGFEVLDALAPSAFVRRSDSSERREHTRTALVAASYLLSQDASVTAGFFRPTTFAEVGLLAGETRLWPTDRGDPRRLTAANAFIGACKAMPGVLPGGPSRTDREASLTDDERNAMRAFSPDPLDLEVVAASPRARLVMPAANPDGDVFRELSIDTRMLDEKTRSSFKRAGGHDGHSVIRRQYLRPAAAERVRHCMAMLSAIDAAGMHAARDDQRSRDILRAAIGAILAEDANWGRLEAPRSDSSIDGPAGRQTHRNRLWGGRFTEASQGPGDNRRQRARNNPVRFAKPGPDCETSAFQQAVVQIFDEMPDDWVVDPVVMPSHAQRFGSLFMLVQLRGTIYPEGSEIGERLTKFFGGADSKAFVDCRPKRPVEEIMEDFDAKLAAYHEKKALQFEGRKTGRAAPYHMWQGFDLASFIEENFERPDRPGGEWTIEPYPQKTLAEHINDKRMENTLDMSDPPAGSSLIALPKRQAIPSNRFAEAYYWDMLPSVMGELAAGNLELAFNTLENMAHQIRLTGRVSNGNRDYYSRTQVATFAILCNMVADYTGNDDILVQYLPELMAEWRNFMYGADTVGPGQIFGSVAMLPDGQMLNVYHDFATGPRPEGWAEELEIANEELKERSADAPVNTANVYEVKRQGARSGIDFSKGQVNPKTGRGELNFSIPLQENAHLVMAERALARALRAGGYAEMAEQMDAVREQRTAAIESTFFKKRPDGTWEIGAYYRTREGKLHPLLTSEIANALWAGTVPPDAVDDVAEMLTESPLMTEWGLAASAAWESDEQWDGARFWALPTLKAVEGLRRFGKDEAAKKVAIAFAENAWQTYLNTGHTFEKFGGNGQPASGGEYRVEADMTMTNETLQWLASIYPEVAAILNRPMKPRPIRPSPTQGSKSLAA